MTRRTLLEYAGLLAAMPACADTPPRVFDVREYGATGHKADDATPAIQKALDSAAAAGGGTVYIAAGDYTSGQLRLRNHVRLYLESGATLYASKDGKLFEKDKAALLYGENLENITIEGRGTIDGQAEYEWTTTKFDDAYIRENTLLMKALNKPMQRSFPKGFPDETVYPRLVLLLHCNDVRIAGLSFVRSRSWTINPYACERLVIDGIYVYSNPKEAVWADGIDPDGCKDVHIANSTIDTGDDALVFYSSTTWGPALPCENITVTNCRLSSASSAIKFCDGNSNCVRRVTIDNTVITNSNRGLAFMVFDGGYVSDVVLSNLTIDCTRHEWFWWGDGDPIHFNIKRRGEVDGIPRQGEPPAGSIRNVIIRDVVARATGTSLINGHPDSWLDDITLDNVKLTVAHDPSAQIEKAVDAMKIRWCRNLKLRDVEITWGKPESRRWQSALTVQDASDLELDRFSGRQAFPMGDAPAIVFDNVEDAVIRDSTALPGTSVFLRLDGSKTHGIRFANNDLRRAKAPYQRGPEVAKDALTPEEPAH